MPVEVLPRNAYQSSDNNVMQTSRLSSFGYSGTIADALVTDCQPLRRRPAQAALPSEKLGRRRLERDWRSDGLCLTLWIPSRSMSRVAEKA